MQTPDLQVHKKVCNENETKKVETKNNAHVKMFLIEGSKFICQIHW